MLIAALARFSFLTVAEADGSTETLADLPANLGGSPHFLVLLLHI